MSSKRGAFRVERRSVLLGLAAAAISPAGLRAAPFGMLDPGVKADRIIVLKSQRAMLLMRRGEELLRYRVELGGNPVGPKREKGDRRTPEGLYFITSRNPRSPYHRALHISYPNDEDWAFAEQAGVDPGGNIAIHGMPESYGHVDPIGYFKDWTNGCIAVGNRQIEVIWSAVDDGTPVDIRA